MLYVNKVIVSSILIALGSCIIFAQEKFYINNLIEINDEYYRKVTGDTICGLIYRRFIGQDIEDAYIGQINSKGKNGIWTRWWDNGKKKTEGNYNHNKKDGFWIDWDINGVKFYESVYKEGRLIQLKNCIIEECDSTWHIKEFNTK